MQIGKQEEASSARWRWLSFKLPPHELWDCFRMHAQAIWLLYTNPTMKIFTAFLLILLLHHTVIDTGRWKWGYVTGKSEIWLHVGSVSFSLTFAFSCFCSLKGYYLYIMACLGEPSPSAWMLNQSAFVQGNNRNLSTCGWLQERRN